MKENASIVTDVQLFGIVQIHDILAQSDDGMLQFFSIVLKLGFQIGVVFSREFEFFGQTVQLLHVNTLRDRRRLVCVRAVTLP